MQCKNAIIMKNILCHLQTEACLQKHNNQLCLARLLCIMFMYDPKPCYVLTHSGLQ